MNAGAVLFDMDGVLVFSEDAWFLVYNETLEHFGHAPIPREAFDAIYGNGTEADRDLYMPERTVAEVDDAYRRFFATHLDAVRINKEAAPVLHELRARRIRTAVATNTNRPLAETILTLAGLLPLFDAVSCADEAGAGKPDPAVLHLASKRLGVPLSSSLFLGDSRFDAAAAAATDVSFVGYRFGDGRRIERLEGILDLLTSWEPVTVS